MSRHVVVNGRELSMNDVGFIDPNSEWSVTVGEDGSVEVNRLDLKEENAKLRELVRDAWGDGHPDRSCEGCDIRDEYPNAESIDDIDPDDFVVEEEEIEEETEEIEE